MLVAALSLACESGTRRERPASTAAAAPAKPSDPAPAAQSRATRETPEPRDPVPAPSGRSSATHETPELLELPAHSTEAATASSPPAPQTPLGACRVALIGDSLTDFRAGGGGFVRYLEKHSPKSSFANFARGGAMVNQMRRHFEASVLSEPAGTFTHLVLFGGVNDLYSDETAGRTPAKIEADLALMYAAAKERGMRIIALSVAPWGGFTRYDNPRRRAATLELNAWILDQPKRGTVDIAIDAYALLSCGDPALLCPRFAAPHTDGLHFGKGGHEVLGKALHDAEFRRCS